MGQRIDRKDAAEIVRMGIAQVMEGRRVFEHLTTEENLFAGAYTRRDGQVRRDLEMVYHYFPQLKAAAATSRPATSRGASSRCWPSAAPS
jgi:branched-chain amino acid transport system ATP-binding protein